ncbi:hypothetical protein C162_20836 [Paenibacillus sp. FSL R7-269]|nr:hypothetical protein C162_20836 [Paenibacillus sp. FSL R7-269]
MGIIDAFPLSFYFFSLNIISVKYESHLDIQLALSIFQGFDKFRGAKILEISWELGIRTDSLFPF